MSFTDFKIVRLEGNNNNVRLTSTEKSRLTAGIFKLSQKVIHGLLTNINDDIEAPGWGGSLLEIFEIPVDPKKEGEVFAQCRSSVAKVESDIISQQAQLPTPNDGEEEAFLTSLELIDVRADTLEEIWRVDIRVHSAAGNTLQFSLP